MRKSTLGALSAAAVVTLSTVFIGGMTTPSQANEAFCDERAHQYASRHARGDKTIGGALVGGTFGAIIGRVVGGRNGTGIGALIGGSTGAIIGADRRNRDYEALYDDAFARCMDRVSYKQKKRRAEPVQLHEVAPEPWSEEWYDYCHAKYRSFNEETGEFLSYSGEYRMCR